MALMNQAWEEKGVWKHGIPFQVFGGVSFYERREVRDLCAYLRIIVNPLDQEAILRVINQPRRGIGEGSLDMLTAHNRSQRIPLWTVLKSAVVPASDIELPVKSLQGVKEFIDVIESAKERFASLPVAEACRWLIERINYKKAIEESVKSDQMRAFKWENVEEFVNAITSFAEDWQSTHGIQPSLQDFVTSHPLEASWQQSKGRNGPEDFVSLMTFHSSKGLEFPICFLVGIEDKIIPHEKSMQQTGLEEERRLMYVALTRAMERLFISVAVKRKRMGVEEKTEPSRFFHEIPRELIKGAQWGDFTG
jgi:DNA helicase-2/ATP-dependent DNA helicase PcrA